MFVNMLFFKIDQNWYANVKNGCQTNENHTDLAPVIAVYFFF